MAGRGRPPHSWWRSRGAKRRAFVEYYVTLLVPWWPNDGRAVADGRLVERADDDELAKFSAECFLQPAAFCWLMQVRTDAENASYSKRCAALGSQSLELSSGYVMSPTLVRTISNQNDACSLI